MRRRHWIAFRRIFNRVYVEERMRRLGKIIPTTKSSFASFPSVTASAILVLIKVVSAEVHGRSREIAGGYMHCTAHTNNFYQTFTLKQFPCRHWWEAALGHWPGAGRAGGATWVMAHMFRTRARKLHHYRVCPSSRRAYNNSRPILRRGGSFSRDADHSHSLTCSKTPYDAFRRRCVLCGFLSARSSFTRLPVYLPARLNCLICSELVHSGLVNISCPRPQSSR